VRVSALSMVNRLLVLLETDPEESKLLGSGLHPSAKPSKKANAIRMPCGPSKRRCLEAPNRTFSKEYEGADDAPRGRHE
ncbi:hypothetical protein BGW38_006770, partial [Lunasporangiospora selenospora]